MKTLSLAIYGAITFLTSVSASAVPAFYYRDIVEYYYTATAEGSTTPGQNIYSQPIIGGPTGQTQIGTNAGYALSSPYPVVQAVATISGGSAAGGNATSNVSVHMMYNFAVFADPGTWVPINFFGSYSMHGPNINGMSPDFGAIGGARVEIAVYDGRPDNTFNGSSAAWRCADFINGCDVFYIGAGQMASAPVNSITESNPWNRRGDFTGGLSILTGDDGWGSVAVELLATSYLSVFNDSLGTYSTSSWIDPYFEIDPTFRAANPDASLLFQPGVKNASSATAAVVAVPEPGTAALVCLAVFGMGAVIRRRPS